MADRFAGSCRSSSTPVVYNMVFFFTLKCAVGGEGQVPLTVSGISYGN